MSQASIFSNPESLRKLITGLMIYNGISHPGQLLVYGTDDRRLVAAGLLGSLWLFVGLYLLISKRLTMRWVVVLPLVMALMVSYKILTQEPNAFAYIHAAIDYLLVALGVRYLRLIRPFEKAET